jgi:hypothetical protein
MAQVDEIWTVFKTVADAFSSVNQVIYGKPFDLNGNPRLQYPCILIDCQPDFTNLQAREGDDSEYLPIKKEYSFKVFFYDKYTLTDKKNSVELQTKQAEIQTIAEQYLGECQRYFIHESATGYHIKGFTNNGFFGYYEMHNDKVVQLMENVTVVAPSSCTKGTFSY